MKILYTLLILSSLIACVPPTEQNDLDIVVDFSEENQKAITDAKDHRNVGLIYQFLNSEVATERYLACEASASIQSDSLGTALVDILNSDPSNEIRTMAAYAIGQQYDENLLPDLISAFGQQDTSVYNSPVRGAILEAIGKCGDEKTLELISSVSTYTPKDNHLLLGQARSIYRFARRGLYSPSGTKTMIARIMEGNIPNDTRTIAAQYLLRNANVDITSYTPDLADIFPNEPNVNVRMALAGTLTRTGDTDLLPMVLSQLSKEQDYRVQSNILRQLDNFQYTNYRDSVIQLLDSENDHLFNLSTQLLQKNAPRQDAQLFINKAATAEPLRKTKLLSIALNSLPSRFINTRRSICNQLTQELANTSSSTIQGAIVQALSLDPLNIQALIDQGLSSTDKLVLTKSIESISTLLTNARTKSVYNRPSSFAAFREVLVNKLSDLMDLGDPGHVSAIAGLLRDPDCGFKEVVGLNLKLRSAMRKLEVPKDYGVKKECLTTLGVLEDTTYNIEPIEYNHPIDWSQISDITDSSRAYIITTKGQIEVKLFKNHAPGSVTNFVSLSQSNYYDGKTIHRVVPNFVIQGGCSRGDGYGGLDYSIRSELGPMYYDAEGYLGMASSGKDTEGTQWFITHSPTPHLDGNYTIFGEVTSGMEIVHSIQEGDQIQDVRILKY